MFNPFWIKLHHGLVCVEKEKKCRVIEASLRLRFEWSFDMNSKTDFYDQKAAADPSVLLAIVVLTLWLWLFHIFRQHCLWTHELLYDIFCLCHVAGLLKWPVGQRGWNDPSGLMSASVFPARGRITSHDEYRAGRGERAAPAKNRRRGRIQGRSDTKNREISVCVLVTLMQMAYSHFFPWLNLTVTFRHTGQTVMFLKHRTSTELHLFMNYWNQIWICSVSSFWNCKALISTLELETEVHLCTDWKHEAQSPLTSPSVTSDSSQDAMPNPWE